MVVSTSILPTVMRITMFQEWLIITQVFRTTFLSRESLWRRYFSPDVPGGWGMKISKNRTIRGASGGFWHKSKTIPLM
jgi:hypothetical protein